MNFIEVRDSISKTMEKAGYPLLDEQKSLLVGALAIWLQKARTDGQAEVIEAMEKAGVEVL